MTKNELERMLYNLAGDLEDIIDRVRDLPVEPEPKPEPKSKFQIGHPLHMSTEEMKAADTALFAQTGGRMGTDWRNAEEKHPGVLAKPGKDGGIEFCWCQKCYAKSDVVHDPFGDGEDWSYCKTCGVSFRLKRKRGEGEK